MLKKKKKSLINNVWTFTYPLRSAVGKPSRTRDAQNIGKASGATKETSIIIAVRIDPSGKRFRSTQCKLHPIFIAHLAHCGVGTEKLT